MFNWVIVLMMAILSSVVQANDSVLESAVFENLDHNISIKIETLSNNTVWAKLNVNYQQLDSNKPILIKIGDERPWRYESDALSFVIDPRLPSKVPFMVGGNTAIFLLCYASMDDRCDILHNLKYGKYMRVRYYEVNGTTNDEMFNLINQR